VAAGVAYQQQERVGHFVMDLYERELIPDPLVRLGIQWMLRNGLSERSLGGDTQLLQEFKRDFVRDLLARPIAEVTQLPLDQHYEVSQDFYQLVLGPHQKYSSAWYAHPDISIAEAVAQLGEAEERMFRSYAERLGLTREFSGRILDLGCGWGALSLWLAANYPAASVVGLSHATSQRLHIEAQARARGLTNLRVITADIAQFNASQHQLVGYFDRVVSVEMFEHMKNYGRLLRLVRELLQPQGRLLVHIFVHRDTPYHFIDDGEPSDWMARHFFSGGTMPSDDLLYYFADDMVVTDHWHLNGRHYSLTLEAWLRRMDQQREAVMPVLAEVYGATAASLWWARWRAFFLACSELFRFNNGNEWFVAQYLLTPRC
jgi:cyclopropane-fatty-acyl-phospholipid synthase